MALFILQIIYDSKRLENYHNIIINKVWTLTPKFMGEKCYNFFVVNKQF